MQIRLIAGLAFACMLLAGGASATTTAKGEIMSPQQERMADCSHQSKGMHGAAHTTFMNNCLKGHGAASMAAGKHEMAKPMMGGKPMMSGKPMMGSKAMQQEKMKDCSAQAKTKKLMGAARKTFMSECLKAH
ncbi:MAG: PsiF family protein [Metallibacterium sp.]